MRWRVTKSKERPFARRTSTNADVLFLWSDLGASFHRRKRPASGGVAAPHWFAGRQEAEKTFCFHPERSEGSAFFRIGRKIQIPLSVPKLIDFTRLTVI